MCCVCSCVYISVCTCKLMCGGRRWVLCSILHLIALRQGLTKPTARLVAIKPQQSGVVPCPVLVLQTYLTFLCGFGD